MGKKDRLDILIEKSLLEYDEELELFKSFEYPDKEIVWQRIVQSIQNGEKPGVYRRHPKVSRGWARAAAALVCILTASLLFSVVTNSKHVDAFRQGFIATIQHVGNKAAGISFNSGEPKFFPVKIEGSLEEVRQASAFDFPLPGELPDGYQLSSAAYSQMKPEAAYIYLIYNKGEKDLRIYYQYQLSEQNITAKAYLKDREFEEIMIDGFPVYYKEASPKSVMMWQHDDFLITATGDLTLEEFKRLYRSMK